MTEPQGAAPPRADVAQSNLDTLIECARRGEAPAQRQIFELYKSRVAGQIQRLTGDPTVVDDLLQEVFIAAFANLGSFRGDSQLGTWLYRIAINKSRNWWDSSRRRVNREHRASSSPSEPETPLEDLETREHRERLYQALGGLPAKLREAFVARVIEGMSLQEASDAFSVSISTISYRTRRAEELLCRALGLEEAAR